MFQHRPNNRTLYIVALSFFIAALTVSLHFVSMFDSHPSDFLIVEEPELKSFYLQQAKEKVNFRLRNTSGVKIHIDSIVRNCACVSVDCSKVDLDIDEEFVLAFQVNTGTFRGPKTVALTLQYHVVEDGQQSPHMLKVFAYPIGVTLNVLPDYQIEEMPRFSSDDGKQRFAILTTACATDHFSVLGANASLPCCSVVEIATLEEGRSYEIRVAIDPTLYKRDDGICTISIQTDSAREPVHIHKIDLVSN